MVNVNFSLNGPLNTIINLTPSLSHDIFTLVNCVPLDDLADQGVIFFSIIHVFALVFKENLVKHMQFLNIITIVMQFFEIVTPLPWLTELPLMI